jgi:acetylornithine aminotransferase
MKSAETKWEAVFQKNYSSPKINIISGKGCYVIDENRKRYLDFIGGIATNILGQAHPEIVKAVRRQIAVLGHVSNLYASPNSIALAEKLIEMTGQQDARVFFL